MLNIYFDPTICIPLDLTQKCVFYQGKVALKIYITLYFFKKMTNILECLLQLVLFGLAWFNSNLSEFDICTK